MRMSTILGPDGKAFDLDKLMGGVGSGTKTGLRSKNLGKFVQNVFGIGNGIDPHRKALSAHEIHAWVYTAAITQGLALSSVPFEVLVETEETTNQRRAIAKRQGRTQWKFAGKRRKSVGRWINNSLREKGIALKGLEPDFDNQFMDTIKNPNPYMKEGQLWFITGVLMALRGECMWILTDANGMPVAPGQQPEMLWPFAPEYFNPVWNQNTLVGWEFMAQPGFDPAKRNQIIKLGRSDVLQLKLPDPFNFWTGLSPLVPLADEIVTDTKLDARTNHMLDNAATPAGLLSTDQMLEETEADEIEEHWNSTQSGIRNTGRVPLLWGGMKFQQLSLTPEQMQQLELKTWDRDTILSTMGTPKASVGVTDDLNYATQKSQDNNFWTKRMFPIIRIIETEIDATILGGQFDDTVGMFNTTKVDALRVGLSDQVEIAERLSKSDLHVPPALALQRAGVEIEEYVGDETALVPLTLIPAEQAVEGFSLEDTATTESLDDIAKAAELKETSHRRRIWEGLQRSVWIPGEKMYARAYQQWIRSEKALQLEAFDMAAKQIAADAGKLKSWTLYKPEVKAVNVGDILIPVFDSKTRMAQDVAPAYQAIKDLTYSFTSIELSGLVVFNIDDPALQKVVAQRIEFIVNKTPATLQKHLFESLAEGLANGETLVQLRQRVSATYNGFASPAKTLQVARTESGGMLNSTRNEMFRLSGITEAVWTDAGDQEVRESHKIFSASGPKPMGFNYLTLVGKSGTLTYPQDPAAPADESVNCRCVKVPKLPKRT